MIKSIEFDKNIKIMLQAKTSNGIFISQTQKLFFATKYQKLRITAVTRTQMLCSG